jgi:hypothetical protein
MMACLGEENFSENLPQLQRGVWANLEAVISTSALSGGHYMML